MKPSRDILESLMSAECFGKGIFSSSFIPGVTSASDSVCLLDSAVGVAVGTDAGCMAGAVTVGTGPGAGGVCSEEGPELSVGGGVVGPEVFADGCSLPITCCSSWTDLDRSENEDCWGPVGCA